MIPRILAVVCMLAGTPPRVIAVSDVGGALVLISLMGFAHMKAANALNLPPWAR